MIAGYDRQRPDGFVSITKCLRERVRFSELFLGRSLSQVACYADNLIGFVVELG
ncbi:hypothetical protein MM1218R_01547 [Mycobacterium marinum]|nr:hypothetical protein MM1218R_01547 [Mycobacterium marinum]RFZ11453.1 hypothetical protein DE4381_01041 [Mycobacterium marinum]